MDTIAPPRAPAPALVVIGSAAEPAGARLPEPQLLDALPDAKRVLEIGCGNGALGQAYKQAHPGCVWHGLDRPGIPLDLARTRLDRVGELDPNDATALATLGDDHDLVVVADGLDHCADPSALLRRLARLGGPDLTLIVSVDNAARWSMLERLAYFDLTASDAFGPAADGTRLFSAPSLYKLMMDAGWMPTLAGQTPAPTPKPALAAASRALAEALGVPAATAACSWSMDRLIVQGRRIFADEAPDAVDASEGGIGQAVGHRDANFTVVVPTTRDSQLRLNVEQSPGLREVAARIVSYRGARDPAEALEQSLRHCETDWVLFCHQDVYFPQSFGRRLAALLDEVPAEERHTVLLGFAGMGADSSHQRIVQAGFVIDRLHRFDHPASQAAVSIDELAIVVARETLHRIDPDIGWHLWATDLCVRALGQLNVSPRIVRLPLLHNSVNDYVLPDAFHESARYLARKHAGVGTIPTLCGSIDARGAAASQEPVR